MLGLKLAYYQGFDHILLMVSVKDYGTNCDDTERCARLCTSQCVHSTSRMIFNSRKQLLNDRQITNKLRRYNYTLTSNKEICFIHTYFSTFVLAVSRHSTEHFHSICATSSICIIYMRIIPSVRML